MPDQSQGAEHLIVRVVEAVEGNRGSLHAVEKSLDGLRTDVATTTDISKAVAGYLKRIADVDEERMRMEKERIQQRGDLARTVWDSKPVQLILVVLALALANGLGLGWFVTRYLTGGVLQAPGVVHPVEERAP